MLEPLTQWQRFTAPQQQLMQEQLTRIISVSKLSKDVYELAAKALGMM
jgi:aminopeptidase N